MKITRKNDFHIHADYSADSKIKLSALVPHAINLGYESLAITEHLDLSPWEIIFHGVPSLYQYQKHLCQIRRQFPQINLYFGVEVGDFHWVRDSAEKILSAMQFDIVLGSVHFINGRINVAVPLKRPLTKENILDYYEQNLHLVESCDINVLSHLGVYKRYLQASPDETHCRAVIKKIFEVMVQKEIALEINFSAFRRAYRQLHPEPSYLRMYKEAGGRLVTIGSDSHAMEHFDDKYQIAHEAMTSFGFEHLRIRVK